MAGSLEQREFIMNLERFVEQTRSLIAMEREEEIKEARRTSERMTLKEQEKLGVCLLKLKASAVRSGLYGRILIVFESSRHTKDRNLPANKFSSGDIVLVEDMKSGQEVASGVVTRKKETSITVAFEDTAGSLEMQDERQYRLVRQFNDVTHQRLKMVLECLNRYSIKGGHPLIDIMFNRRPITPSRLHSFDCDDIHLFNTNLDHSQRKALAFALSREDIAIIHGPPGTGKTTTVVELILQVVARGSKVLACAPSNVAVDNLVEQLAKAAVKKMIRLGHPARLSSAAQAHCLDAVLAVSEQMAIVKDVRKEMDAVLGRKYRTKDKSERAKFTKEMRLLKKELQDREQRAIKEIIGGADVVLSTNTGATSEGPLRWLKKNHFGLVVIDEASQALEVSCWIPLMHASRCVLAGDHHQLPPTILSDKAAREGLSLTLMERALAVCGKDNVSCMLTQQYRMHEVIMNWASQELYDNQLTAHKSVEFHLLRDLPSVSNTPDTNIPLLLIDTAGCDRPELETSEDLSKGNEGEADIVASHVGSLIEAGVQPSNIAVITPYNLQVEMIRNRLVKYSPVLEISSVDGFQGREKEAVVLTLVRSNKKREVGFLSDYRRINVAVTRARRHLAVVADSDTVCCDGFIKILIDYMGCHGEVRSAVEYDDMQKIMTAVDGDVESMRIAVGAHGSSAKNSVFYPTEACLPPKQQTVLDETGLEESQESIPHRTPHNQLIDTDQLADCLREFLASDSIELAFDPALSAQERYFVHEAAEKYHLTHYSKGDGKHRQVVVEKKMKSGTPVVDETHSHEISCEFVAARSQAVGGEEEKPGRKQCLHCKQWIPSANIIVHEARCGRIKTVNKPRKNQLVKSLPGAKESTKSSLDDDQLLMTDVAGKANCCAHGNCKELVSLTGQLCKFCHYVYCLKHSIPEVHGCGDDAKKEARNDARKSLQKNSGSKNASQGRQQLQRLQLQQKLGDQLEKLKKKRTGKQRSN